MKTLLAFALVSLNCLSFQAAIARDSWIQQAYVKEPLNQKRTLDPKSLEGQEVLNSLKRQLEERTVTKVDKGHSITSYSSIDYVPQLPEGTKCSQAPADLKQLDVAKLNIQTVQYDVIVVATEQIKECTFKGKVIMGERHRNLVTYVLEENSGNLLYSTAAQNMQRFDESPNSILSKLKTAANIVSNRIRISSPFSAKDRCLADRMYRSGAKDEDYFECLNNIPKKPSFAGYIGTVENKFYK